MEIRQIHKTYVVYGDAKALDILATYHQILFPAEPAKTSISKTLPTSFEPSRVYYLYVRT